MCELHLVTGELEKLLCCLEAEGKMIREPDPNTFE